MLLFFIQLSLTYLIYLFFFQVASEAISNSILFLRKYYKIFLSLLFIALKIVKHPAQESKTRQVLVPAWLHRVVSFEHLSLHRRAHSHKGYLEHQGELVCQGDPRRRGGCWVLLCPTVHLWHRWAERQWRSPSLTMFSKTLSQDILPSAGESRMVLLSPMPKYIQEHVNQCVLTAGRPIVSCIAWSLTLFACSVFSSVFYCCLSGSLALWIIKSFIMLHLSSAIVHAILLQTPAEFVFWYMDINYLVMIFNSYHTRVKQRQRWHI